MSLPADARGLSLKARVVVPVDGPPVEGGVIEVGPDGRIVSLRAAATGRGPVVDLGDVALLPGLVNAHAHLEFSSFEEPLTPGRPFVDWVTRLVGRRRSDSDRDGALRTGFDELRANGTAAVGEIVTAPATPDDYLPFHPDRARDTRPVLYREIIATRPEQTEIAIASVSAHLAAASRLGLRAGICPHATYTVEPSVYRRMVKIAADGKIPFAVHIAETVEERRYLAEGDGPLAKMLTDFGAGPTHAGGLSFADYLRPLADVDRVALVHANVLDDGEIAAVAAMPNATVVFCPRTHAFFGHGRHPWRELLARGGRVAFGTDGRGSNPDLSVWREVLHVAAGEPDEDRRELAATLIRCVTFSAAVAVGVEDLTGTIRPGLGADFTLFDMSGVDSSDDAAAAIVDGGREPVAAYRSGRLCHPDPAATMPA